MPPKNICFDIIIMKTTLKMVTKRFDDLYQSYDADDEETDYYNPCLLALKNGLDILEYLVAITQEWVEFDFNDDDLEDIARDMNKLMIQNYDFMKKSLCHFEEKVTRGNEQAFFREYLEKLVVKLFTSENKLVDYFDVFGGKHSKFPTYDEFLKYMIR